MATKRCIANIFIKDDGRASITVADGVSAKAISSVLVELAATTIRAIPEGGEEPAIVVPGRSQLEVVGPDAVPPLDGEAPPAG